MKTWRAIALLLLVVAAILASLLAKYKGDGDEGWVAYQNQVEVTETNELRYAKEKAVYEEKMGYLQGAVDSSNAIIAELEGTVAGKEVDIEKLEQLRPLLSDKDAIIKNQDEQLFAYKGLVSTLKRRDEEKSKVIFSLTGQVQETGQMLLSAEAQIQAEKELRLSAERGWSLERARTSILRRQGRLSRSVIVGSLSAAGVAQIKGASPLAALTSGLVTSVFSYIFWK